VRGHRILLLLIAWVSFDLATPLPGAFEFEAEDSEIEESIHVRRHSHDREAAARRALPWQRPENEAPTHRAASAVLIAWVFVADEWLPQVRLAHLPAASPPSSSEDH
jgi:hypothetical protein